MKLLLASILVLCASSAAAQVFPGCTKARDASIRAAIADAKRLTVVAAASVGDHEHYERWFGVYSPVRAEKVRRTLKSVAAGIRTGAVTAQCDPIGSGLCSDSAYAFVDVTEPYRIHICPKFFDLPKMSTLNPGDDESENGTRAGTIIHEVSHFEVVASTDDECYSRSICEGMARRSAERAIRNADSYQYYAEDVMHFGLLADTE